MKSIVKKWPVVSFLVLNYAVSWTFLYPAYRLIIQHDKIPSLAYIGLVGAYGPSIAAILISWIDDPKSVKALLKKIILIKFPVKYYLLILCVPVVAYILSHTVSLMVFDAGFDTDMIKGVMSIPIWFLLALPFGPMGEELGWRGFLLPRLLKSHSPIFSTIFVGIAWGVWHLASFTFPGAAIPDFLPVNEYTVLLFIGYTVCLSFLYTAVHFRTGGSVFAAIFLHAFLNASSNIANDFLGETSNGSALLTGYFLFMIIIAGIGLWLMCQWGKKHTNQRY